MISALNGETYGRNKTVANKEKNQDILVAAVNDRLQKDTAYSSAPEQAVIGEIEVIKTLKMKPTPLWNSTKANAGISRSKYRKYFSGCTMAYAFVIGSFEKYPTSKSLADFNIQSAPQSFVYLDD